MGSQEFVETLRAIMSSDNTLRSAAEKRFSDAKASQPSTTVAALFQVLAQQQQLEEPLREQGAVLLRQCLSKLKEENSIWRKLGAQAQEESKAQLLQLFQVETSAKVRRKLADCIQSLGNQLIDIDVASRPQNAEQWPQLMPGLLTVTMDASKDVGLRSDAVWAVKELLTTVWPIMLANRGQTEGVLKACLADGSVQVQANAACMFSELIDSLEDKEDRASFKALVEDFCGALKRVAEVGDEKSINSLLQSMEATDASADFFRDCMASHMMPILTVIAKSHNSEEIRRLALEVLISFAQARPKAMAKVPGFVEQTLDVCANFLLELNDDLEEWADQEDDDAEDEEQYTAGKEGIDRLCRAMHKGEKFNQVLEVMKPVLSTFLQSSNWKQVVTAITMLSQIAEYVDDEAMVSQMVSGVKLHLVSAHARVRHSGWSAVAQLAEDHADFVTSEENVGHLLEKFLTALDDPCERVVARSMEAFQLWGQNVERELLEPFVQPFMAKLGAKLQTGSQPMKRRVVTFIAVIAGQVEDAFAPYYGQLMPVLKQLVQTLQHSTEERTLLGKAFECISLLAKAVGSAGFRADAEGIMTVMTAAAQVPDLPSNDPVKEYMLEASQRICCVMKADFLPFVPHILPGVLEKCSLATKEQELDQSTRDGLDDDEEVNLVLMPDKDGKVKVMVMSTAEIEDLQNALECIHTFVEELGKLYAPFVAQTAQALLPCFDFQMQETIRDTAFETWGELCKAARDSGQAQVLTELVHEFLNRILPKLEAKQQGSVYVSALKTQCDGVAACLKKCGQSILTPQELKHICTVALTVLSASLERREALKQASKVGGNHNHGDEEDAGEDDDDEEEPGLRIACCEVIGSLMHHHADSFATDVLQIVMPVVEKLIQAGSTEDRKLAIYLVCDMLEHLGPRMTAMWPQFMPALLQDILNPDAELRQPACYGASLAARNPAFAPVALECAGSLAKVVTESRGRAKKKSEKVAQACADNALSALVEILMHHKQTVAAQEDQLWNVWLQGLPCQEDEEEGKKNHGLLLLLTQQEEAHVVGKDGANLTQVLSIFVEVYKTDMASEETSKGIAELVARFGEARLEQLGSKLKEKQQKKIMRIFRDGCN